MELLHCKNCGDVYALRCFGEKSCSCGYTSGTLEDGIGVYKGDPFLIHLDDESLHRAISNQVQLNINEPQKLDTQLVPNNSTYFKRSE